MLWEQIKHSAGNMGGVPESIDMPVAAVQRAGDDNGSALPTKPVCNYLDLVIASRNARGNPASSSGYTRLKQLHSDRVIVIRQKIEKIKKTADQASRTSDLFFKKTLNERRRVVFEANRVTFLGRAINYLHDLSPQYSSRKTFTLGQVMFFAVFFTIGVGGWLFEIPYILKAIILLLTGFYLCSVICRCILLANYNGETNSPELRVLKNIDQAKLPNYSIVVALYHETSVVQSLCDHLAKLSWPKDRLEIKLICEASDNDTIQTIKQLKLPDYFDLIVVPDAQPRTKPKALNYALPLCTGKYLVLYDAEDRPDPYQLLEAYHKFETGNQALVCLQSPLRIYNRGQSWFTQMFAIEYCTQFEGILPVLERWQMPIPLGGTSNHFKLAELKNIGAWDPYNVTEDADLGIRICRTGFLSGTLKRATYEEAPPSFSVWLPQRTRWIKGWMQTILVHSRSPRLLFQQMGWKSFCMFHLLITSVVLSSLIHPIFVYVAISQLLSQSGGEILSSEAVLRISTIFVLVGGYLAYGLLAYSVLKDNKLPHFRAFLLTLPIYWFLISIAGWRALIQLLFKPHFWEKTPHGLTNPPNNTTLQKGAIGLR